MSNYESDFESISTDTEYNNYNSDRDSDYDFDDDTALDILYNTEEVSHTNFNIILCELYNEHIHGPPNNVDMNTNYLVLHRYKNFNSSVINADSRYYNKEYREIINTLIESGKPHPIIKNYFNIIVRPNYIKPEIAKCIYLETEECICVLKTIWLRLIQRTWKKIYNTKNDVIKKRCLIISLIYRENTGRWPSNCIKMPTLKGMLYYLSK